MVAHRSRHFVTKFVIQTLQSFLQTCNIKLLQTKKNSVPWQLNGLWGRALSVIVSLHNHWPNGQTNKIFSSKPLEPLVESFNLKPYSSKPLVQSLHSTLRPKASRSKPPVQRLRHKALGSTVQSLPSSATELQLPNGSGREKAKYINLTDDESGWQMAKIALVVYELYTDYKFQLKATLN